MGFHLATKFFILLILQNEYVFDQLASSFGFAYGPFLLLATKLLTNRKIRRYEALIHFTPFCVISLLYLLAVVGSMGLIGSGALVMYYKQYIAYLELPSFILYNGYSLYLLSSFQTSDRLMKMQKNLLQMINILLILVVVLGFPLYYFSSLHDVDNQLNIRLIPYTLFVMIAFLILQYKLRSASVRTQTTNETKEKYEKSGLQETDLKLYQEKLDYYILHQKPYLNSELTLLDLSSQLDIPRHHLTQLLNSYYQRNFYHFINEHRITEAIRLLENNQSKGNLLSLAYEVGFHSKSTFNTYFKKVTGTTPSQYRKNLIPTN
ncbi:hypothetical protein BFP72_07720 [Reichenbachiella sp. 5M10]|nr:hypothetical protein BFP72_07720 [Reichenbachiella sp. 5M10]